MNRMPPPVASAASTCSQPLTLTTLATTSSLRAQHPGQFESLFAGFAHNPTPDAVPTSAPVRVRDWPAGVVDSLGRGRRSASRPGEADACSSGSGKTARKEK